MNVTLLFRVSSIILHRTQGFMLFRCSIMKYLFLRLASLLFLRSVSFGSYGVTKFVVTVYSVYCEFVCGIIMNKSLVCDEIIQGKFMRIIKN